MLKRNICRSGILAGILTGILLSGCSMGLVQLKYADGQLYNKRLGLTYNAAPINYAPVVIGEAYGYYKDMDMTLYEIQGQEPTVWLTQENSGNATTVFYDASLTLPTLAEMAPHTVYVCAGDEVIFSVATIDDETTVSKLVTLFESGEAVEWPLLDSIAVYELEFYGDAYPFLYYNLTYGEFPEGVFLYDRNTKRCVEIGDLLADWIALSNDEVD